MKNFLSEFNMYYLDILFFLGAPNFVCEECGLTFKLKWYLILHKRTHLNIKPYTCTHDKCTCRFTNKKNLLRHILIHSSMYLI